ncbi:MAG TPA: DUF2851 family protein [Rariglobus sp.]|nr:DUF2851 family protein [Rariglobus sp.]
MAEIQGLYGPFSFSELLLQKIWDRRDFSDCDARTLDGRRMQVLHPGRWNRLGGPDFSSARLRVDGKEIAGDIELHLHAADWVTHRHANDPAYDNVILHVVLFPSSEVWTAGAHGGRLPVLVLLPLLHRGLEEYAEEDVVETLANRPLDRAFDTLGAFDEAALGRLLNRHAAERWKQKTGFARERIRRLGWEGACHHAALEVLGYRLNRAPMLAVATEFPLAEWRAGGMAPDTIFETRLEHWSLHGVRPLNHPRLRLKQYAAWVAARPDWPERLRSLAAGLKSAAVCAGDAGEGGTVREVRRRARLTVLRTRLAGELCAATVTGSRFDNLVCDGFLPLLAAGMDLPLEPLWRNWFAGDAPDDRERLLRKLNVFGGASRPASHGPLQGLLGWMLAAEKRNGC